MRVISGTRSRVLLLLASAAAFLPSLILGQTNQTGKIFGTATDNSGAAVPGVTVTLTSPALIVPQSMKTDEVGAYHFEQIPLGTYTLSADLQGFNRFVRENIQITAGFAAEIRVQLTVGELAQTVTVSEAGPVVDA